MNLRSIYDTEDMDFYDLRILFYKLSAILILKVGLKRKKRIEFYV